MLKKIYIDNYKSLVNFSLDFGAIGLLLGKNGSGKSTVFEVLSKLSDLVNSGRIVETLFLSDTLTKWQSSPVQAFEITIERGDDKFRYEIAIEHDRIDKSSNLRYERLWLNEEPLLKFESNEVELYGDDHTFITSYAYDWTRSAIASIPERRDNRNLIWFRQRLQRIIVVQLLPPLMGSVSDGEDVKLDLHGTNFVSWYRHISQDQGRTIAINQAISEIIDHFHSFRFSSVGRESRVFEAQFQKESNPETIYEFHELSDGQRTLIVLYSLMYYAKQNDYTLCIDEPENFLELREIQPWISNIYDMCIDGDLQSLFISHHPELIDYLIPAKAGIWLERKDTYSPTRMIEDVLNVNHNENGLPISELIARDWIHG